MYISMLVTMVFHHQSDVSLSFASDRLLHGFDDRLTQICFDFLFSFFFVFCFDNIGWRFRRVIFGQCAVSITSIFNARDDGISPSK